MSDIMPVHELLHRKPNATFFNAQIEKLKAGIQMYERKIKEHGKEHAKLMKRRAALEKVPIECRKIKCPPEEKPLCVKFFDKDGKRQPFHATMINKCEMRYMKCRKGLEAKIVSKRNCHSILDTLHNPEAIFKTTSGYKRPAARRVKRNINEDAATKQNDINQKEDELTENNIITLSLEDNNTSIFGANTFKPMNSVTNDNTEMENIVTVAVNTIDNISEKLKATVTDISTDTKQTKSGDVSTENTKTATISDDPNDSKLDSVSNETNNNKLHETKNNKLVDVSDESKNIKKMPKVNRKYLGERPTKNRLLPKARKRVLRVNKTIQAFNKSKLNLRQSKKVEPKTKNSKSLESKADDKDININETNNKEITTVSTTNETIINNSTVLATNNIQSNDTIIIKNIKEQLKDINGTKLAERKGKKKISREKGEEYLTKNTDKNNKMFKHDVFGGRNKDTNNPLSSPTDENGNEEYMEVSIETDDKDLEHVFGMGEDLDAYQKELEDQGSVPEREHVPGAESIEMKGGGVWQDGGGDSYQKELEDQGSVPEREHVPGAESIEMKGGGVWQDGGGDSYQKELEDQGSVPEREHIPGAESIEMKGGGTWQDDNNGNEDYITGTIEIDDADLDKEFNELGPLEESSENVPSTENIPNTENIPSLNGDESNEMKGDEDYITGTIEIDDDNPDFNIGGSAEINPVAEGHNMEGDIKINDDLDAEIDIDDVESAKLSNDAPLYDPTNPLVEEPDVGDSHLNDDRVEFVPGETNIVDLSDDGDDSSEQQVEQPDDDQDHRGNDDSLPQGGDSVSSDHGNSVEAPEDQHSDYGGNHHKDENDDEDDDEVDKEEMNAECPTKCPSRHSMVCAKCAHGVYRTFLSICHMRMYSCRGQHGGEKLELVSHRACVMSAPIITDNPSMRPVGHLSLPGDKDSVLIYVRCRERGLIGKSPKCQDPHNQNLNQGIEEAAEVVNATETAPSEY